MSASVHGNEKWEDETVMTRRRLLIDTAVGLAGASITPGWMVAARGETFEVTRTDAEWRKPLTPDQFAVLRMSATERPFTSTLLHEKRRGNFACAGCELDLFSSTTKYESGAVDAIAQAGRLGAVIEDVTLMAAAPAAVHCGSHHAEARVLGRPDGSLDRRPEARPSRAAVILRGRGEQRHGMAELLDADRGSRRDDQGHELRHGAN